MLHGQRTFFKKFLIISVLIVTLFNLTYFTVFRDTTAFASSGNSGTKFVLYWSPFGRAWDYHLGYGFEPFKNCEYKNCFATANRTLIPLEKFDALIFHATYSKNKHGIPWVRSPHQRYIFMNLEAPVNICPDLKQYASYFNWTMSYRFDSDIVRRHGFIFKEKTKYTMPSEKFLKNKTSMAAWLVSHCHTKSHREVLCKEIEKFIPVDVYGACGKLQCKKRKDSPKLSSSECYEMIEKKYKFYFSFENSYCRDYSTEKLYNILLRDLVPVVYGAGDYQLIAPPNSVINAADFESATELAGYLKFLDQNPMEYSKYFEWKKKYKIITSQEPTACQICKKLHRPSKQSIYHDLHGWWWGKNESMCKTGNELPKIVSDLLEKKKQ